MKFATWQAAASINEDLFTCAGPGEYSLLHYAVEGGNRDLVKLLLDDGMGCNSTAQSSQAKERAFTPLHLAARLGFAELVPLLLDDGYTVDTVDKEGRTPLHCASLGTNVGWYETMQPGAVNASQRTTLEQGSLSKDLLSQGTDAKAVDPSLYSAMHYTSGKSYPRALHLNQISWLLLSDKVIVLQEDKQEKLLEPWQHTFESYVPLYVGLNCDCAGKALSCLQAH